MGTTTKRRPDLSTKASARRRRGVIPELTLQLNRCTLANGLRVVLAPDPAATAVAIVVAYDVGFRSEPEGRTGFAHLFEHLMFEGSVSLPKSEHARLIQGNGGVFNGHTTPDATVYHQQLPANALELGLFLEADRMRAPIVTDHTVANQISVVKEEIRVNVLNRPYGGFPWILLPPVLFSKWNNSHNGYGSFVDLEAATVDDALDFFNRYYAPGNAVLCVAGQLEPERTRELIERHFGDIPARRVPKRPSFAEPVPKAARHEVHRDEQAPLPAVAIGYRTPDPMSALDDYLALAAAVDVLADGPASRFYKRLISKDGLASHLGGYLGAFGDPFDQRDPVAAQVLVHHPGPVAPVLDAIDEEIERMATEGAHPDELERMVTSSVAGIYRRMDDLMGRAQMLAQFERVRGDAGLLTQVPSWLGAIELENVAVQAGRWLRKDARAVLEVVPGEGAGLETAEEVG